MTALHLGVGLALGLLLGAWNVWGLRWSVRRGLRGGRQAVAMGWIFGGYLARYAVIGAALYGLMREELFATAVTMMATIGAVSVTAAVRQKRGAAESGHGRH